MNMQALQQAIVKAQIFYTAMLIIGFIVSVWVSYLVIKAAIRDGIKESGLIETLRRRESAKRGDSTLPDMRAD